MSNSTLSHLPTALDSCKKRWKYKTALTNSRRLRARDLSICRDWPAYWVKKHCLTYDPRIPATIPFDLFPKQVEFLDWLAEREKREQDGLVEKSRDMGVTWLCCAYAVHGWLFRPGFAVGFGSRKLELVDKKGDMDSIFEKIRFLIRYLPRWMLPGDFNVDEDANIARVINPATGASITGEGGDHIGRGGRKTMYFVDEAAFLEHPLLVDRSLSQTTKVKIDVSTPNGPGNPFATKRFGGKVPTFTFHWKDDPRKGEEWYRYQKEEKYAHDPVGLAQEVDIDYNASVEGICIPAAWVRAAVDLHLWAKQHKGIEFPQMEDPVSGLDIGEEGKNLSVLITRRGVVAGAPRSWGQVLTTETAYRAQEYAVKDGSKVVNYDANAVGAGVKGIWNTSEKGLPFKANGVMSGGAATESRWPDGKTSKEKFLNLRAELWWRLRVRFEKAYEFRELGKNHPIEEMISIPHHPQLIAELSLPLRHYTNTGKIQLESKSDMRKRGVASPDFADALVLCFAPSQYSKFRMWQSPQDIQFNQQYSGSKKGGFL